MNTKALDDAIASALSGKYTVVLINESHSYDAVQKMHEYIRNRYRGSRLEIQTKAEPGEIQYIDGD